MNDEKKDAPPSDGETGALKPNDRTNAEAEDRASEENAPGNVDTKAAGDVPPGPSANSRSKIRDAQPSYN